MLRDNPVQCKYNLIDSLPFCGGWNAVQSRKITRIWSNRHAGLEIRKIIWTIAILGMYMHVSMYDMYVTFFRVGDVKPPIIPWLSCQSYQALSIVAKKLCGVSAEISADVSYASKKGTWVGCFVLPFLEVNPPKRSQHLTLFCRSTICGTM